MLLFSITPLLLLHIFQRTTNALVTLQTIRELTDLTDDCRERMLESGDLVTILNPPDSHQRVLVLGNGGGGNEGEGEEVEETVTAALRMLASEMLRELEVPVGGLDQDALSQLACKAVIEDHHSFLQATVRFLHAVQERQMHWRWGGESTVFDGVSWLQSLWASRKANAQSLSLIEQQVILYKATTCFGKEINKEVLRRDVEIVEYLNELIDMFQ